MKSSALKEKQVDGIARGAGADVKTKEDAKRAVQHVIAGQRVALIKPKAVNCRHGD